MPIHARLSHVALGSADPTTSVRFYEDNVGLTPASTLDDGRLRLGWGRGHHALELVPGGQGLDHFALEFDRDEEREALERRLGAAGVAAAWTEPPGDDHPPALRFSDPAGHEIEVHGRVDRSGEAAISGRRPIRIHHVTVTAPEPLELARFYTDVLGFAVSDRMGDQFVWLRSNRDHHSVAIVAGPGGLDHYCYEIESWEELKLWCDALAIGDVPVVWGPGRHGPGNNLFIMYDDPDGHHIELSCEIERFWDDRAEYPAPRNWAQQARTVNLWGPVPEWRRSLDSEKASVAS